MRCRRLPVAALRFSISTGHSGCSVRGNAPSTRPCGAPASA